MKSIRIDDHNEPNDYALYDEVEIDYSTHGKNEKAWNLLFNKYDVLECVKQNGYFEVTANVLNNECGREARLMAKVESHDTMPSKLKDNDLCILPYKTRGHYIIGFFDAFLKVSYDNIREEYVESDLTYDTLCPYNITKEPSLILTAYNYGILDSIVNGQQLKMTNFGRESTPEFDYYIDNVTDKNNPYKINVGRSQLEMDGVFESTDYVVNIEAKMSQRSDFLARQLYYPYRLLREQTDKNILNVFMTYSADGSMYTHVYSVDESNNYNSFCLLSATRYNFYEEITVSDISNIVRKNNVFDDPDNVIFPQADSMSKVFDTMVLISQYPGITDSDIAYRLGVVDRQGGYYGNACEYLGISYRTKTKPKHNYLTPVGEELLRSNLKNRNLKMIDLLSRHKVFNHFIIEYLDSEPANKHEIESWIRKNITKLDNDKDTAERRASTVKRWIDWAIDIVD